MSNSNLAGLSGMVTTHQIADGSVTSAKLNPAVIADIQDMEAPPNYKEDHNEMMTRVVTLAEQLDRSTKLLELVVNRLIALEETTQSQALKEVWARNYGR